MLPCWLEVTNSEANKKAHAQGEKMQFASHFSFCSPVNIASFASLSGTQSSLCPHHFAKTASQAAPGVSSGFQVTTVRLRDQVFMWSLPGAQLELE